MEKALYNGNLIDAFEVSKDYSWEKTVRRASRAGNLKCPDKDCDSSVLRYCHGDKKAAYFAHRDNSVNCEYLKYDKQMLPDLKEAQRVLYENLKDKGYLVDLDTKILRHHYSPISINLDDEIFSIELVTKQTYVNKVENISRTYANSNLKYIIIIVGKDLMSQQEDDMNYIERYLLNESDNNDFIILDYEGSQVIQCRFDTSEYIYNNQEVYLKSNNTYQEIGDISSLVFEYGSISIEGFNERFNNYLISRKNDFNKEVERLKKIEEQIAFIKNLDKSDVPSILRYSKEKQIERHQKAEPVTDIPVKIEDLKFIEQIELREESKGIEIFEWNEMELKKTMESICYKKESLPYKFLMVKIKYGTDKERELIKKFYKQAQAEGRTDYRYIIKTACKVY